MSALASIDVEAKISAVAFCVSQVSLIIHFRAAGR
jgi:hypothetical protein